MNVFFLTFSCQFLHHLPWLLRSRNSDCFEVRFDRKFPNQGYLFGPRGLTGANFESDWRRHFSPDFQESLRGHLLEMFGKALNGLIYKKLFNKNIQSKKFLNHSRALRPLVDPILGSPIVGESANSELIPSEKSIKFPSSSDFGFLRFDCGPGWLTSGCLFFIWRCKWSDLTTLK